MIVIIDYEMGNVQSVKNAIDFLGYEALISRRKEDIRNAKKLILPGVGSFKKGIINLKKFGLIDILTDEVINKKKPVLGICLGMQLLAKGGEEGGKSLGLGWIDANVRLLKHKEGLKIPHVGWDNIKKEKDDLTLKDIPNNSDFYFVHSYAVVPNDKKIITSTCTYGEKFASTINQNNIYATQFHPEKSQESGLKILENFIKNA
jgi:glutamine amidotransferase